MKFFRSSKAQLALGAALVCLFAPSVALAAPEASDAFTQALDKGPLYAALAAFAGGFLASLTPCVYPMVAITVSVFGAAQSKSRWQGASLSLAFVLGIVAMLVPLGVIAGQSGMIFGAVLQNRWVVLGMAALFLALASAMFGAFEFALPSAITNKLAELGGIGYKGAFLLGAACGLIATPCTGPVLTGILAFIAKTKSSALGAAAMTAFGVGLGVPFFAVGTFAVQLPKSGAWMVHVKSILGIVLVVVALHYVGTVLPVLTRATHPSLAFFGGMFALVVLGALLGAVHREFGEPGAGVKVAKALGIVCVSAGLFLSIETALKPNEIVSWEHQLEVAQSRAQRESRPLLVDFGARWCTACKELDKVTFASPDVAIEMSRFVNAKVDASEDDDPKIVATLTSFKVRGLPTVVVLDSHGKEALRFNDFVPPELFLPAIKAVE
ncbi:MAG TPA: cytochrome c biogenesis protein CcdA [Polyangiaceae bacterium]|nr:cytochrome c biogenesis protein CcdA [Polyangiaceae bacterium]